MDFSIFLTVNVAAIGFFVIFRKFRFHQENQEINPSSSYVSPPASLSTSSPSMSLSHNWIHDVFPSFRGEDVRIDFLSHIQKEFRRKGITPFFDNEIKRGESIGPELIRAIRGSKIAVILLSRNYASSKWCLDELVEIMKCREEVGQTVMAVFYKVDPSHVKKLTGDFGKVFRKTCAGKSKEDTERWSQALVKLATIAGYDSRNWDNEAAMIEKIAIDVSNKLINSVPSSDFDDFVGMRTHMEKIEPFLHFGSNEVRMIGIWGPSGIGKSTIARALFSKHSHQFQLSVFMANIKRRYPNIQGYDEYSSKLQLQREFLSQIINHVDIKIHHLGVAQDRLKDKRVLVVLDDVDHSMQLEAMAKETRWFGPGSRIIITTQDKKLLKAHGINDIYWVDFPANGEALEIFCMYAFGQNSPYDGFESLAWKVTQLAGKLPLGLRVLGSYLKGMPKQGWEEELPRLRKSLDGKVESILMFSYHALCDEDKDLFIYIACFFNNQSIKKVEEYLANNFSNVRRGLQILVEKSLISVSSLGNIEMHDLLARLGREIVRKQCIHDPGQRQFLVDARDICKVLNNNTTTSGNLIGTIINFSGIEDELNRSDIALERFSTLQFLRLNDGSCNLSYLPQRLNYLPPKVRLLDYQNCLMTSLPSNFNPEFLEELKMCYSKLEYLWKGNKTIRNIKWMDLSYSGNLKELPDLSSAINLHDLDLSYCSSLVELPSSIENAINLRKLVLHKCSSLVQLPSSIGNATNLEELNLHGCSSLVELSSSIGNATNLNQLILSGCSSLMELPSSIGNVINLESLDLSGCSSLVELPSSIGNVINLKSLDLIGCSSLVELPSSIGNVINLERLDLSGCSSLVELPSSIGNVINLWRLKLSGCSSLVELPSSIGNVINLWMLNLSGCSSLVELPSSTGNITRLWKLDLNGCSSLVELPSSIGNLCKLSCLLLKGCSKLEAIPINMESIKVLDLIDCLLLKKFPEISTNTESIKVGDLELRISYWEQLGEFSHAFKYITELHLSDKRIQEFPPSVKELSSLYRLVIKGCTKLVSLPQLPDSLQYLNAENCESLERLHYSFHNKKFRRLEFANCFKLNQEARDLIMSKASSCENVILPGEKVPPHFTYRATGSFLSVKLNGTDTQFPTSFRFKTCVLLVRKGDFEVGDWNFLELDYSITEKQNGVNVTFSSENIDLSTPLKKHLLIFQCKEEKLPRLSSSSSELVFEFFSKEKFYIEECGIEEFPKAY